MILHECSCFIEFIERVGGKELKCEACLAFYRFFTTSLLVLYRFYCMALVPSMTQRHMIMLTPCERYLDILRA